MKRAAYFIAALMAVSVLWIGCSSPGQQAQKLYDAGRYEEVVAKYSNEPSASAVVQQSRDKIAEKWFAEGRYQAVVDTFPNSPSARAARIELAKTQVTTNPDRTGVEQPRGSTGPGGANTNPPSDAARETVAQTEFDRIMAIKMKDLRTKGLREFVADARYTGTAAARKAQQELDRK